LGKRERETPYSFLGGRWIHDEDEEGGFEIGGKKAFL
jgi:hypothetical protein